MKTGVLLVAEDDPDDQLLVQEALEMLSVNVDLRFVWDGNELLNYLYVNGDQFPAPGLILLDLNMPGKDGRTALQEIKAVPKLANIPLVVLTTSRAEDDTRFCLGYGVDGYYHKPSSFIELTNILNRIVSQHL